MNLFESDYDRIDSRTISLFRKKYNLSKFPNDYTAFLLNHNGGLPKNDTFDISGCDNIKRSIISYFYSIPENFSDNKLDTLNYAIETFSPHLPKELLPIAIDDFGDLICLSLKRWRKKKVYIWVHDMISTENGWENIFPISNSFADFLNSLTSSGLNEDENIDEVTMLCRNGDLEKLKTYLEKKLPEKELYRITKMCAYYGQLELLKYIRKTGVSLNGVLFDAIASGQIDTAMYLLREIEDPCLVFDDGSTWLHLAAEYNQFEIVQYLISKGCPVNQKDSGGFTAYNYSNDNEIEIVLRKEMGLPGKKNLK